MKRIDCLGKVLFMSNLEIGASKDPTESIRIFSRILHEVVKESVKMIVIAGKIIADKVRNRETVMAGFSQVLVGIGIPVYIIGSPDGHFLANLEWTKPCITEVSESTIELDTSKYSEEYTSMLFTMGRKQPNDPDNIRFLENCAAQMIEFFPGTNLETEKHPWVFFGFAEMCFISTRFAFGCCGNFLVDAKSHQYITILPDAKLTIESKCLLTGEGTPCLLL